MPDGTAGTDHDVDIQQGSMVEEGIGLRSNNESDSDDKSEISTGPHLEPRRPHAETPIQDAATTADTTNALEHKDSHAVQADSDTALHGV